MGDRSLFSLIFFLFLSFFSCHGAAMEAVSFGLDAIGGILGKMAAEKEAVVSNTEGYKREAVQAYHEVTNIKEKAEIQVENLVAISSLKDELLRQNGIYIDTQTTTISPLYESLRDFYDHYIESIREFSIEYNGRLKSSQDKRIISFSKIIAISIQKTFDSYVHLLKKYNKSLEKISTRIKSKDSNKDIYKDIPEPQFKIDKNFDVALFLGKVNEFISSNKTMIDGVIATIKINRKNNSENFSEITTKLLDSINLIEDKERKKNVMYNKEKIFNNFVLVKDLRSKIDICFDEIDDLVSESLGLLYKMHLILEVNWKKIVKMLEIIRKIESDKSFTIQKIINNLAKEYQKSESKLEKSKKYFLALNKNKESSFIDIFKKINIYLKFFNDNINKLDYTKVSKSFEKIEFLMSKFFRSFSLKNNEFKNSITEISFINSLTLGSIKKLKKLQKKADSKTQDNKNTEGLDDSSSLLSSEIIKDNTVKTNKKKEKAAKNKENLKPNSKTPPTQIEKYDNKNIHSNTKQNEHTPHQGATHHNIYHQAPAQQHSSLKSNNTNNKTNTSRLGRRVR